MRPLRYFLTSMKRLKRLKIGLVRNQIGPLGTSAATPWLRISSLWQVILTFSLVFSDVERTDSSMSDLEDSEDLQLSTTQWLDLEIVSHVSVGTVCLNRQLVIERIERLSELPTYWPVARQKTAYIIHDKGELLSADALIKNKVCPTAVCVFFVLSLSTILTGPGFVDRRYGWRRFKALFWHLHWRAHPMSPQPPDMHWISRMHSHKSWTSPHRTFWAGSWFPGRNHAGTNSKSCQWSRLHGKAGFYVRFPSPFNNVANSVCIQVLVGNPFQALQHMG